jgi:hypothetical protein
MRHLVLFLVLTACAPDADAEPLTPREQLIRASLDLRGVPPRDIDLRAVDDHPELYGAYVDLWLEDPRFAERVRELFAPQLRTLTGETRFDPAEAGLLNISPERAADSLGQEPLRLMSWVAEKNLPWTDILLADYTMADPVVAAMWGVEAPFGAGWEVGRYLDRRPAAGILASTTLWERYPSAGANANRSRANAMARILLCEDFLARPVSLSEELLEEPEDPEVLIATRDDCQACHKTLDPLASNLFGFWTEGEGLLDATRYRPEREETWRGITGRAPGWYGVPTTGLREMAERVAKDPKFVKCTVKTVYEGLLQRPSTADDRDRIARHRDAFELSDLRLKALVRSILLSPEYRTRAAPGALTPVRTATPGQLAARVESITGYRWSFDGRDALTHSGSRLATLAGGIDSVSIVDPSHEITTSRVLVHERLAWSAAWHAVNRDLGSDEPDLLTEIRPGDRPEAAPERFEAQCRGLLERATGLPLDDDAAEPDELTALWKQAWSITGSEREAWTAVVAAVLRDPRVLTY